MAKKPLANISRLIRAMFHSRRVLSFYREERRESVRQYVGSHWGENGADKMVPLNLISLYVQIVVRQLIAKAPRVMLSTHHREVKPQVEIMQDWANHEIVRLKLANTLQRAAHDALFSLGIVKVGLCDPPSAAYLGWKQLAGQPFAERVDLDDFVFDVHARDFSEVSFIGHRYRVPLDLVRDSKLYHKARKDLTASSDPAYNLEGDERIGMLGRGYLANDFEEFKETVDLWEIYLPQERVILTLPNDYMCGPQAVSGREGHLEALRSQRWLGPDTGPYHLLAFGVVPGNPMPKAPIQDLIDLHLATNNLARKLLEQARRQKEVLPVRAQAKDDGDRLVATNDGEAFACDNADTLKAINFGGPNQQNFALMESLVQRFSWLSGNLDMMGGLSPQSKTATQDKLLAASASGGIADKQDTMVEFTAGCLNSLCWYWWHDPYKIMKTTFAPPGLPEMAMMRYSDPKTRMQGKWEDIDVRVDPYAMQHNTPQSRLTALRQVWQQDILPAMPIYQQQGIVPDLNFYLKKVGAYLDDPDIADFLTVQDPPTNTTQGGASAQPMPQQNKTSTHVRENMPGRTEQGDTMNRINTLMGVNTGGAPNGSPHFPGPGGAA